MRKCHIYLVDHLAPILVMDYKKHKIKKHGYSIFIGRNYEYRVDTSKIKYFSIDREVSQNEN